MYTSSKRNEFFYFARDLSWLSFNKRILSEAQNPRVPLYQRIRFLSIFCSNLEEFFQIRIAGAKDSIKYQQKEEQEELRNKESELRAALSEIAHQEKLLLYTWEELLQPALRGAGINLITDYHYFDDSQRRWAINYFRQEVFPFLQPTPLDPSLIHFFLRDNRLYFAVEVVKKSGGEREKSLSSPLYFLIKLPHKKVPRILTLPQGGDTPRAFGYTFLDEVIRLGLPLLFSGYEVQGVWALRVTRDADIAISEAVGGSELASKIPQLLKKRKMGSIVRFIYDASMPAHLLDLLSTTTGFPTSQMSPFGRHLQLQILNQLPNPLGSNFDQNYPTPLPHQRWDRASSKIAHILNQDEMIVTPYQSFHYILDLLREAAHNPEVREIFLTQYRVAEESQIIDTLVTAAQNGKRVTVFIELKARFDEENNLRTAERMINSGVQIIYSLPKLKVHAKIALIRFHPTHSERKGIALLSTGNFNEDTARIYSDITLFTSNPAIVSDLDHLFSFLTRERPQPLQIDHLLVATHGMKEEIIQLIQTEKQQAQKGKKARIILKMNALEDLEMIDQLYEASMAGVEITLLVRGICRLVPDQPFSQNIKIIRLVDIYLEHARIWYFYHKGEEKLYLSSADWMRRNLHKRIEYALPVMNPQIKNSLKALLTVYLKGNEKTTRLSNTLENIPMNHHTEKRVRTQEALREVIEEFSKL